MRIVSSHVAFLVISMTAACSTAPPLPTPTPSATSETAAPPRRVVTSPEAAQRLARAIPSDILLYNDEAVRQARDRSRAGQPGQRDRGGSRALSRQGLAGARAALPAGHR